MKAYEVQPESQYNLIPNFCRGEAIAQLLLQMELMAVVFTLLGGAEGALLRLCQYSIYMMWIGLSAAFLLCTARKWLRMARIGVVFFVSWGLLVVMTLLIADIAWALNQSFHFALAPNLTRGDFLLRNVAISAIISVMLLRFFWGRAQLENNARVDSESRYLALQARIRPHFLFNALNSIASLISTKPDQAEELVIDLADLFRASLEKDNRLVTLAEEIEFVKTYLRIETTRLGDKCWINWAIEPDTLKARIPLLLLQPLLENAVYHGVSRLSARGGIYVSAQCKLGQLIIDVENPIPPSDAPLKKGTGVAMDNIVQRLKLIYGPAASLVQGPVQTDMGPIYQVKMRMPFLTEDLKNDRDYKGSL